jgi:hypothetical protein
LQFVANSQTNDSRVWQLSASSPEEAATLAASLSLALVRQFPPAAKAAAAPVDLEAFADEDEMDVLGDGGIWLLKKGEGAGRDHRRLFVLVWGRTSKQLKANYYAELVDGVPTDRKGTLLIAVASDVSAAGPSIAIVRPEPLLFYIVLTSAQPGSRVAANSRVGGGGSGLGPEHPSGPGRGAMPDCRHQPSLLFSTCSSYSPSPSFLTPLPHLF